MNGDGPKDRKESRFFRFYSSVRPRVPFTCVPASPSLASPGTDHEVARAGVAVMPRSA